MAKKNVVFWSVVIAVVIAFLAAFMWQNGLYYLFHYGPARPETNSVNQSTVQATYPTPTPIPIKDWFANVKWYSVSDAAQLRTETDVVNVALLKNGGVYYAVDFGIPFSPSQWTKAVNVYQITSASVRATTVSFTILSGDSYDLNVLQPFVIDPGPASTIPPTFWVFDQQGQLWRLDPSQPTSVLTPISQVKAQLPFTVAANPGLSPTTGR